MSESHPSSPLGTALLEQASGPIPTRRAFPRYDVSYPILIEVEAGSEPLPGLAINLCRSGLLARIERTIGVGTVCNISFPPEDRHRSETHECPHCGGDFQNLKVPEGPIRGTVVRVEKTPAAYAVAIMFETPLETDMTSSDAATG